MNSDVHSLSELTDELKADLFGKRQLSTKLQFDSLSLQFNCFLFLNAILN